MLRRTVFTDNGFLKCSWAHVVISFTHWCRVLMQGRPRDQRSWAFSVGFRPCRLRTEISPDSLNLLMILWTIYDEIPKFLSILRWNVLKLFDKVFSRSCSQSGVPRPILACEWLSLSGMLFLYPIIAPNYSQLTCSPVGCSKQVFDEHSSTFSVFLPPFPTSLSRVAAIKF